MAKNKQPEAENPRAKIGSNSGEYNYDAVRPDPAPHLLGQIRKAAQDALAGEAAIAKLEEELEKAKEKQEHLLQRVLPNLMEQAESGLWKAPDGVTVEVQTQTFASISKENESKAFAWLEKHNLGDLIKRTFEIKFGRGDEKWAEKFAKDLKKRKKPLNAKVKKGVHPQTLNANVKDILQEGKLKLPLEVFGVFQRKVAKVTVPEES